MTLDPSRPALTTAESGTPFAVRALRASLLRAETFEEIEADPSALRQSFAIVLLCCGSAALGAWLHTLIGRPLPPNALPLPLHILITGIEPLVLWLVAAAFTYMVGATFLRGPDTETDYAEVLRTTGFAFAPGVFYVLGGLPNELLSLAFVSAARLWVLVACIVAVRQALDFTTARAVATYGVASLLMWVLIWGLTVVPIVVV